MSQNNQDQLLMSHSTAGGIDIRNSAGSSVGDRKPLASGNGKSETLPIASLAITMQNEANATAFFSHWEEVTGCSINEVLGSKLANKDDTSSDFMTADEGYLPPSFFAQFNSKHGIPVASAMAIHKTAQPYFISQAKKNLPAKPGDLLWLINQFLLDVHPNGGEVDLISASLHKNSVFKQIGLFCSKAKYKHHPHLRTFLAYASMAEMGLEERAVSANAMLIAVEVLRDITTTKSKTANLKIGGEKKSVGRKVLTIGGTPLTGAIFQVTEPELEQDIEVLSDMTDDEDEGAASRKRAHDDEDDEDELAGGVGSSKSGGKALRRGQSKLIGAEDEDDDMFG
jgi:hypothetical protein